MNFVFQNDEALDRDRLGPYFSVVIETLIRRHVHKIVCKDQRTALVRLSAGAHMVEAKALAQSRK